MFSEKGLTIPDEESDGDEGDEDESQLLRPLQVVGRMEVPPSGRGWGSARHCRSRAPPNPNPRSEEGEKNPRIWDWGYCSCYIFVLGLRERGLYDGGRCEALLRSQEREEGERNFYSSGGRWGPPSTTASAIANWMREGEREKQTNDGRNDLKWAKNKVKKSGNQFLVLWSVN